MRRWVAAVAVAASMAVASPAAAEPGPLFRPGEDVDYQLGGVWDDVPDHVGIVVRDRKAVPLEGRYNVCYVNGFQTQPDEKRFWRNHWRLVLKDDGRPVVDSAWGEWLLDIRTADKRQALARDHRPVDRALRGRRVRRGRVRQPRLLLPQPPADHPPPRHRLREAARRPRARRRAAGGAEELRRVGRLPTSSTSRSPRSAAGGASATATRRRTAATCWPSSTGARTSGAPATGTTTSGRSCSATST